jgi:hypothetical protein
MRGLIPLTILAFLISPFALSGFRRAWRGATVVLVVLAFYTAFAWSRPIPAYFDEQDQLGAGAWQMMLLTVVTCGAVAFVGGYAASLLRSRHRRKARDELSR